MGPGSASLSLTYLGRQGKVTNVTRRTQGRRRGSRLCKAGTECRYGAVQPLPGGLRGERKARQGPSGRQGVLQGRTHRGTQSGPGPWAGGTSQRNALRDPGSHTSPRSAPTVPSAWRPRRSCAHFPERVCGIPETWSPRAPERGGGEGASEEEALTSCRPDRLGIPNSSVSPSSGSVRPYLGTYSRAFQC